MVSGGWLDPTWSTSNSQQLGVEVKQSSLLIQDRTTHEASEGELAKELVRLISTSHLTPVHTLNHAKEDADYRPRSTT